MRFVFLKHPCLQTHLWSHLLRCVLFPAFLGKIHICLLYFPSFLPSLFLWPIPYHPLIHFLGFRKSISSPHFRYPQGFVLGHWGSRFLDRPRVFFPGIHRGLLHGVRMPFLLLRLFLFGFPFPLQMANWHIRPRSFCLDSAICIPLFPFSQRFWAPPIRHTV